MEEATAAHNIECLIIRAEREGLETWAEVLPELVSHIQKLPLARALAYTARAHAAQGNEAEALKAAQDALSLDPTVKLSYAPYMMLARFNANSGRWAEVIRHCDSALASSPGDLKAGVLLARAKSAAGTLASGARNAENSASMASSIVYSPRHSRIAPSEVASSVSEYSQAVDWRDDLREGQAVEVYSSGSLTWTAGSIVQTTPDYIKVKHSFGCALGLAEKWLPRSSDQLRLVRSLGGCFALGGRPQSDPGCVPCIPASRVNESWGASAASSGLSSAAPQQGYPSAPGSPSLKHLEPFPGDANVITEEPRRARSKSLAGRKGLGQLASTLEAIEERPSLERPSTQGRPSADERYSFEQRGSERLHAGSISRTTGFLSMQDLDFGPLLGDGRCGSVYRGTCKGQAIVIKKCGTLHAEDMQVTSAELEEFRKEIAILSGLRHSRLARFVGAAFDAAKFCIVTEFLPNGSLHALMHERKHLLVSYEKLSLAIQMTEGIAFLHAQTPACIHQGLTSKNILLDQDMNAKICDFGLSQANIDQQVNQLGPQRYKAPELFEIHDSITGVVDMWALGCLVAEVFTKSLPHEECVSAGQVMSKLLVKRQLPFLDWTGVNSALLSLIQACVKFQPESRISAAGLLEGLVQLQGHWVFRAPNKH